MRPRIGISIGDVAGIGPEVVLGALRQPLPGGAVPVIFGSIEALRREVELLGSGPSAEFVDRLEVVERMDRSARPESPTVVDLVDGVSIGEVAKGESSPQAARLQGRAFERAVRAARAGEVDAVVTAPWNKSAFELIGEPPVGHTDRLDAWFPDASAVMMLAGPRLRVSLATTHVAVDAVRRELSEERLRRTVETTIEGLERRFGLESPSVAVCGLNPHAGESGTMGTAEGEMIGPVLGDLHGELADDASVDGPFPADTLFARYRDGGAPWDAVVCMYHDQGLIPLKLLHFGESANVTLGLPIVRTSVDHGTAYDIAGEGRADPGSMR
ncbi:MAG: 4-hydroxythreonine-4-phosphate dehydrogenase PdxA, partial [Bradymonadaceae bacterium]